MYRRNVSPKDIMVFLLNLKQVDVCVGEGERDECVTSHAPIKSCCLKEEQGS